MQKLQKSQIAINSNQVIFFEIRSGSSFHFLLSHPENHACVQLEQDRYTFQPLNNKLYPQIVCIVELDERNKVINTIQAPIQISIPTENSKQSSNLTVDSERMSLNLDNEKESQNPEQKKVLYITKYEYRMEEEKKINLRQLEPEDITMIMDRLKPYGEFSRMHYEGFALALSFPQSGLKRKMQSYFILPFIKEVMKSKFCYYAITQHLPIFKKITKILPMPMPKGQKFRQLIIHSGWIVARSKSMVIFIRNRPPFNDICRIQIEKVTCLITFFPDKLMLAQYKYLHIYSLEKQIEKPTLYSIVKLRGLEPYCFAAYGNHCLFAGMNHSNSLWSQEKIATSRSIYLLQNFKDFNFKSGKGIISDRKILVCENIEQKIPIQMLYAVTQLQLAVCYFNRTVYVVHTNGTSGVLSQVQLDVNYKNIKFMPYCFNLLNFIGVTRHVRRQRQDVKQEHSDSDSYILRVGLDSYVGQYGLQLKSYTTLPKSNVVVVNPNFPHSAVYILDSQKKQIIPCNIVTEKIDEPLLNISSSNGTIELFAAEGRSIVYILRNQENIDFYHLDSL